MKRIIMLMICLMVANAIEAQVNPKWIRYPAISPDGKQIVFTYKGDLYVVSSQGGDATQITFHEAHDYMPVWSKDGNTIAFASDRYGNFDIYTMDARGGAATRVTFHSTNERPYTFSHDDKYVLFGGVRQDKASHRQYYRGFPELYKVPVSGGKVDQVLTIAAEYVQVSKNGEEFIYHDKKGGESEWRKHHTSSITRDIWSYNQTTDSYKMITSFEGEDRQPVYSEDEKSIYYLSEESGNFNVHKLSLDNPSQKQQLTKFKKHPVRFLSRGGEILCFGYDGELYTMQEGQQPKKLKINIRTQEAQNKDRFISVNGGIREMDISPNGKEIAFIARGEVFVTSVDGSLTKRITNTPEQEQFVEFTPDGKSVVYSAERNGKWSIYQTKKIREEEPFFFASTLLEEEALIDNKFDNYEAKFSPDGKKVAYVEERRTLKVMDLETKRTVTLLTPEDLVHMSDGDQHYVWSPDSKWLLVQWRKWINNYEILLISADGKQRYNLTESGYNDMSPLWVNGGQQMLWTSNRHGLRSYATTGESQLDVYSLFFTKDGWDKFNMSKEDYDLMKEIEKAAKKEEESDSKSDSLKVLTFDWDGMIDRKARLTIHSSSLADAVLSKEGDKLYYLASFEKDMNLWSTNLRTKETKMLMPLNIGYGSLKWDKEMKNLYLLSGGRISKVKPEEGKREQISIRGEMEYDADAERQYMFDHVWIRTKAVFYHSNFHGIDWDDMGKEYRKYIPHLGNSYEFSELVSELVGELNVSHAWGSYSRQIENPDATASLGVFMDYNHTGNGILIEEIIKDGPLDKASLNVSVGMIIESIDGETISRDRDVASYLNRKAGKYVLLGIIDPSDKSRHEVTVKPISASDEARLLYDRWVKKNEDEVAAKSNGQLGYVHLPGMADGPYRDIYEDMMGKYYDKKGMIIDTRFNSGGDLVADLAMFFTGESFITYATEDKDMGDEPTARWTKPTLALLNEAQYSDGHCFASGYTDLKIGKTVGMPVPGTCSYAGWEGLPDGSRWGVITVSAKNKSGEWMENNQTEPQIKVKNMFDVIEDGRDQQLERAIEELLKDVNKK